MSACAIASKGCSIHQMDCLVNFNHDISDLRFRLADAVMEICTELTEVLSSNRKDTQRHCQVLLGSMDLTHVTRVTVVCRILLEIQAVEILQSLPLSLSGSNSM